MYLLTPSVFGIIDTLRPSGILEKGRLERGFVDGWWKDTGTPDDVIDANRLVLGSGIRSGARASRTTASWRARWMCRRPGPDPRLCE